MPSVPNSGPAAPPPPVWDARPPTTSATGYGGFWMRVLAYIVDGIVLNIAFGIIGAVVGISLIPADPAKIDPVEFMANMGSFQLVAVVVTWLYFALMESSPRGATVGKMVVGLRVVDEQGNRLSFLRATGRFFAKFISTIILFIGYLMVAFTERKRGLHDIIAGTLVVKTR
ncbi:MAG: RDD family protein [Alphaproteobacteria bacterium]|nr:MAG: RDD family protein [Alphaproteobacteria bacterium]